MKNSSNISKLTFSRLNITELNEKQLVQVQGADLGGAIASFMNTVSYTQNLTNSKDAMVAAEATYVATNP